MKMTKLFSAVVAVSFLAACHAKEGSQLSAVHFDYNSAKLSYEEQALVNKVAMQIKRADELRLTDGDARKKEPLKVKLFGHADKNGSYGYNQKLSMKRAEVVRKALINQGIEPTRVSIEAFGDTEATKNGKWVSKNPSDRRVDIRIVR